MKKIFTFFMALGLTLALMACGTETTTTTVSTTTQGQITKPTTQTTAGTGTVITTKPGTTTVTTTTAEEDEEFVCVVDRTGINPDDIIEIDYMSTDPQDVEERMACAYQQANPNVIVNVRYDIVDDATAAAKDKTSYLVELASTTGYLPDVFQLTSVENAAAGKILYDFANEFNSDPDTEHLFPAAKAIGAYGANSEKRLAMVNGQAVRGVMLNKTLLNELNLNLRNYGFNFNKGEIWTVDEMLALARTFSEQARGKYANQYYYGVDGEYSQLGFNLYFPSVYNDNLTYWALDKTTGLFDFTSANSKFIQVYQQEIDLLKEGIRPNATAAEQTLEFGATVSADDLFFTYGRTLMFHAFSYNFFMMQQNDQFEYMFLPLPEIDEEGVTSKTFGETGAVGLSKFLADDPAKAAVAYDFAKYVTWGEEGFAERIEFNVELGTLLPKFPVSDYNSLWDRILEIYSDTESVFYIEGLDIVIENLLNGTVELGVSKTYPGVNNFKIWLSNSDADSHRKAVLAGTMQVADVALIWEQKANELIREGKQLYENYPN